MKSLLRIIRALSGIGGPMCWAGLFTQNIRHPPATIALTDRENTARTCKHKEEQSGPIQSARNRRQHNEWS